jgi:adenine-specific DNA-methyltransferase
VDEIIEAKKADAKADTKDLEAKIDCLVYQLYELTPAEIEIVEGKA